MTTGIKARLLTKVKEFAPYLFSNSFPSPLYKVAKVSERQYFQVVLHKMAPTKQFLNYVLPDNNLNYFVAHCNESCRFFIYRGLQKNLKTANHGYDGKKT